MLNPFPGLLDYALFAPMLLRIAVACVLFCIAWRVWSGAKTIAKTPFPLVGTTNPLLIKIAACLAALVGVAFFVGYGTQIAAIIGILISLKLMWFRKELGPVIGLPRSTYVLVIIICLSLLLTGAGLHSFDLPL